MVNMLLILYIHVSLLKGRQIAKQSLRKSVVLSFDPIVLSLPYDYV